MPGFGKFNTNHINVILFVYFQSRIDAANQSANPSKREKLLWLSQIEKKMIIFDSFTNRGLYCREVCNTMKLF